MSPVRAPAVLAWRLLRIFDEFEVPVTFFATAVAPWARMSWTPALSRWPGRAGQVAQSSGGA